MSEGREKADQFSSNSALTKHRECPQKWMYAHVRRLEKVNPMDVAVERDFGSWWHLLRAADSLERGRNLGTLKWVSPSLKAVDDGPRLDGKDASPQLVFEAAKIWWEDQTPYVKEAWVERIGDELPQRLMHLFQRWNEMWADEIETEQPLAVEFYWERLLPQLPQPHDLLFNPNVMLVGYVDEVYYDTRRHLVVVRDHKVHKQLATQTVADDMMDSQLQLYAWGSSPVVNTWDVGRIQAIAYDRARMVKPKEPVVTQAGSLSKSVTDYDLATYTEWCAKGPQYPGRSKDGSQAGTYQLEVAIAEKLSTPQAQSVWFQRTLTPLNVNIIKAHLRSAVDSSVDMSITRARAEKTGAAARNLGGGCRWCDFNRLCRAEMVGGVMEEINPADYNLRWRPER